MSKKSKEQQMPKDFNPLHPERKLVSRRDFLSTGAIGFGGMAMLPTALEMALFSRTARAGEGSAAMPPLLIFDCAGGAALPGNWPPMDSGGNPLANYSDLGLQTTQSWTLSKQFGAPMAAPLPLPQTTTVSSQIYAQLAMLPSNVQSCIQMGIMPLNTMSDSQSNTLSPISLATAAGCIGSKVVNGLGTTAAESGGNSDWGSGVPGNKPMQIKSADSLAAALSYGAAFKALPQSVLDTLANTLINLSGTQAANFNNLNLGQQFNSLLQAGYTDNLGYTAGVSGIDSRLDADCISIYGTGGLGNQGLTAGSVGTSQAVVYSTLALNAIMGNCGPVVLTISGCDYHDGTQTSGDSKDTEIGLTMASALQLAYKKGKKVCFIVYTDGGIYSDQGLRTWRGDNNQHGLAIFGVMDPNGTPAMAKTQVGFYNSAGVTDPSLFVGNNPLAACHALFLNYLAVAGATSQYASIIASQDPRNTTLMLNAYGGSWSNVLKDVLMFPDPNA